MSGHLNGSQDAFGPVLKGNNNDKRDFEGEKWLKRRRRDTFKRIKREKENFRSSVGKLVVTVTNIFFLPFSFNQ